MASAGHEHAAPVDFGRRGLTGQTISPNQIYSGGTGSQTYISDPASSQTLSANENTALLDLYSALIRGSPAEAHFHSDWHSMTSTGNLCAFQGMWYQVFEPGQRSVSWNMGYIGNAIDNVASWCVIAANGVKVLDAIDLDLVPPTTETYNSQTYITKDPGQVQYLSDATHCHSRNWYAMIATQQRYSKSSFFANWGPAVTSKFGSVQCDIYPQTKCLMSYNAAGILPSSISSLTMLTSLRLRMLGIARQPIPSWIGSVRALTSLDLSFNSFTGSLPDSLYELTNLVHLHLNDNFLSGTLSAKISHLTALKTLEIGYHSYQQYLYEEYGAVPESIEGSNQLRGSLPSEICLLTSLRKLQLNSNTLTGSLPACIAQMSKLRLLDVSFNRLTGTLPSFYTPTETTLSPPLSNFYCPVKEDGLPAWEKMFLKLANNQFSGSLDSLSSLATGRHAGLDDGYGCSSVPDYGSSIWAYKDWISIRGNLFHGTLPDFILSIPNLGRLDVGSNSISGTIPLGLSTLKNVNLASNRFHGTVPSIFKDMLSFEMSSNLLTGTLPSTLVSGATALKSLTIRNNLIKQDISEIFGMLTTGGAGLWFSANSLVPFAVIDLTGNLLFGTLPSSIFEKGGYMMLQDSSIQSILLGNNSLSGTIPSAVQNLKTLATLDLSYNSFTGTLPTLAFSKMTNLENLVLRGNVNLLPSTESSGGSRRQLSSSVGGLDFIASMTSLQLIDVFGTGIRVSSIPSTLPRGFQTLSKFSDNCYSVQLLDSICTDSPDLQTITLDGMATDDLKTKQCEEPIWQSNSFGFNSKRPIVDASTLSRAQQPTIPSCLFSMTGLQTLHLSLNGYVGTLPETVSSSLQELVISHNFLTGTIPLSFQRRKWAKLDLSYNMFSGVVEDLYPPLSGGVIDVSVNRLSGRVPKQLHSTPNVSLLQGNLFSCNGDRSLLPQHDPFLEKFTCGSDTYNSSLYACAAVILAGLLVLVLVAWYGQGLLATSRAVWSALVGGLHTGDGTRKEGQLVESGEIEHVGTGFEDVGTGFDAENGPVQSTLQEDDGHIIVPAKGPLYILLFFQLILAVVNIGVVIAVNIGFVLIQQQFNSQVQAATKTALSIFKVVWNTGVLGFLDGLVLPGFTKASLRRAHVRLYGSRGTFNALLLIFNNIFAPLFASAVADVNCFSNAIYQAAPVTISYYYEVCESFYGGAMFQTCLRNTKVQVPLTYAPSFSYSYLCTSHIVTSYVPVFVQSLLIAAFSAPLTELVLLAVYRCLPVASLRSTLRGLVSPFYLSRADRAEMCLAKRAKEQKALELLQKDEEEGKYTIPYLGFRIPAFWKTRSDKANDEAEKDKDKAQIQQRVEESREPKLFNADAFLTSATNSVIICATFGAVAPLLAVVQVASVCLASMYLEFKVDCLVRSTAAACKEGAEAVTVPPQTLACLRVLVDLRRQLLTLGAAQLLLLAPFIAFSIKYSVFSAPEAWVTTYSFVHGTMPATVMLVLWNLLLLYFRWIFYSDEGVEEKDGSGGEARDARGIIAIEHQTSTALAAGSGPTAASTDTHSPEKDQLNEPHKDQDALPVAASDAINAAADIHVPESATDFMGLGELERDAASMNAHGIEDIEWAIHLFAGLFLGAFVWDSAGGQVGWREGLALAVVMLVVPSVLSLVQSLLQRMRLLGPIVATLREWMGRCKAGGGSSGPQKASLVVPFEEQPTAGRASASIES